MGFFCFPSPLFHDVVLFQPEASVKIVLRQAGAWGSKGVAVYFLERSDKMKNFSAIFVIFSERC
jgi:hypothetical protein